MMRSPSSSSPTAVTSADRRARGGGRRRGVQRVAGERQPHLVGLGERDRRGELDEHLAEHDDVELGSAVPSTERSSAM